jgi:hypothetical protein
MAAASNFICAPVETFPEFLRLVTRGDVGTRVRSGKISMEFVQPAQSPSTFCIEQSSRSKEITQFSIGAIA